MDKKKVLIIGSGAISGLVAKALGEMAHYDIEKIDIMDGPFIGFKEKRADLMVCDEMSSLAGMDFSALEDRFSGLFDAVLKDGVGMYNTGNGQTITGRQLFQEPEPQRLPRSNVQQDIYEMLAVQSGRSRGQVKDILFPEYYGHRGSSKTMFNALRYKAMFSEPAADHPTRKREPKGPRGKWGKLK